MPRLTSWKVDTSQHSLLTLGNWCLRNSSIDVVLLAVRLDDNDPKRGAVCPKAESLITRSLGGKDRFYCTGWPGTKLSRGFGLVYVLDLDAELLRAMAKVEPNLSSWLHDNSLPEDLCFIKRGARCPALISVTHEGDAWLISDTDSLSLAGTVRTIDDQDLAKFIFEGDLFCEAVHRP